MYPVRAEFSKALYTPSDEVVDLKLPTCRSSNCTWNIYSSLAVCVDMKSMSSSFLHGRMSPLGSSEGDGVLIFRQI